MNKRFLPLLCAVALLLTGCAGTAGDTSAEPSGETSAPVQEEPDSSAPAEAAETDMAYMWITDLTEDAEFDQYIQQESTMKLMQELNARFQQEFDFQECNDQQVYYVGQCDLPLPFVQYGDPDLKDQRVELFPGEDKVLVTPLTTWEVGKSVAESLNDCLAEGRAFGEEDFAFDPEGNIPMLAGWGYRDYTAIGDTFDFYYLDSILTFEVVGFLEAGTTLTAYGVSQPIDYALCLPFLDIEGPEQSGISVESIAFHYMQRNDGFIGYDRSDPDAKQETIDRLNALFQELGVNYNVYDDYEFVFAPFQFYVAEQAQSEIQEARCHTAEKLPFLL
ncbi:MAG: hypothetical protein LUG44_02760 [Clostridiales bacterium]|nr:hypothetical protein [Clostridiales bacterium]